MGKISTTFLFIIILIIAFQPQPQAATATDFVTITAVSVNIREGPSLSYPLVTQVKKGEKYPILKEKNDWSQISLSNGKTGWVANWLTRKTNSSRAADSADTPISSATASTDQLRVRSGPGINFQIIGYLNKGQKVTVIEENENWIKISTSIGEGWVSNQFIMIDSRRSSNSSDKNHDTRKGIITESTQFVRKDPSSTSKALGKLTKGMKITIYSQKKDWLEINYSNHRAWVKSKFVDILPKDTSKNSSKVPSMSDKNGIMGTVTASSIHIRNEASLRSTIVGTVNKGQSFIILAEKNNWAKIEYKSGKTGWIVSWYLDKASPKSPSATGQEVKQSTITILQDGSNIRKSPNLQSNVVERANVGDHYTVSNLENNWYQIKLKNGTSGYIAGWIVSINGSAPKIEKPGAEIYFKNRTIVLDPGHGGVDNGTTGAGGTLEKDLTIRTATLVYDKLKAAGANVILTRNNDSYISLPSRVRTSISQHADAFVSLHYDSSEDRSIRGMTGYYYSSHQKQLAEYLYYSTMKQTKLLNRGIRNGDFHVIRENKQNAALLELGYLSNLEEEMTLNSKPFQENAAAGIYNGLAHFFKDH